MLNAPFQIELTHPLWLLGLLALPVLVLFFYRSLVDFARWQRWFSLVSRSAMVVLLVLALAGLTLLKPTRQKFVIFVVDRSLSVGDESKPSYEQKEDAAATSEAEQFLNAVFADQARVGDHKAAFLSFAARAAVVRSDRQAAEREAHRGVVLSAGRPENVEQGDPLSTIPAAPENARRASAGPAFDRHGTNIAAAIEAAAGAMPPDYVPEIVLLSDGNQTAGDALQAALSAGQAARGRMGGAIPISTVPLQTRSDPEVQVSAVHVPAQVREGEPFFVEVVIDANHDDDGLIEVFQGAHKVVSERRPIKAGENRLRFQRSITQERLAQFTAKISGLQADTLLDNNTDTGLVFTDGKPRVLVIESDPKLVQQFAWALQQEDIQVDVRPPQGMPDSLADLQNYELLVLSNVPATLLTQRQMELTRTYVQDLGGGFMMLGGDQSFGLGGYYKTVLEEILPVRSDFEKEKEKPGLGMVLVIDKSGSMGGDKIEMAKAAAKSAAELLGPKDQLGVLAFDGGFSWVSPFQSAANKSRIIDDISRIQAGGGTTMAPAMEEAFQTLQNAVAKLKHVIVLTDGISSPGDFQGIAQNMASARMTCSTVAIGDGADNSLLEEISRIGQGRFYHATDPSSVPQIFAKETVTASKSAINEQPFVPQVMRPTQTLADIDFETAPFLLGYVMTRPKATSEVILASEQGDPLLSWWRYGLGTTVAFTSDAKARWGAEWLTWPGFSKFWAQVVRHAMRKNETKGVTVEVRQSGRRAVVTLDAIEPSGKFLNQAETELTVIDPQLGQRKLAMQQTAPGRYVVDFETAHAGAYHLDLSQKSADGGNILYHQSRGLIVGYADELRLRPTNTELLQAIATASGGRFNPPPEAIYAEPTIASPSPTTATSGDTVVQPRTAPRATPLWPYLVMIAATVFLVDVALRRIDFSLVLGRFARMRFAGQR